MEQLLTKLAFKISRQEIDYTPGITTDEGAIANILLLVYTWAGIVAVVVIIIAGLLFVTSRGDANQMKRSKDAIRGAVIGLIVVMVAFAITRFIIGGVSE